jgi:signal transduction histidine kinase
VELEQVLLNLVNNAAYAMKDRGGAITLRTALAPATGNPLRCDAVYLAVEDEGSGIDPEDLPNIFQPFFTTKPVGEGTGLGLAAAYGIVQSHQGHIEVRSAPGGGTCFDIWLPVQPLGRGTGTQA